MNFHAKSAHEWKWKVHCLWNIHYIHLAISLFERMREYCVLCWFIILSYYAKRSFARTFYLYDHIAYLLTSFAEEKCGSSRFVYYVRATCEYSTIKFMWTARENNLYASKCYRFFLSYTPHFVCAGFSLRTACLIYTIW